MAMIGKIRRIRRRDKESVREIAHATKPIAEHDPQVAQAADVARVEVPGDERSRASSRRSTRH